jgi:predicted nucleotide-binding protein
VRDDERRNAIRELALLLRSLSEPDADAVLKGAGLDPTRAGWGNQSDVAKMAELLPRLAELSEAELEALLLYVPTARSKLSEEPDNRHATAAVRRVDETIFVIHGRARDYLYEVVRVLERGTGREVVILHEQANAGRTILEKFEDYAGRASFAVVLLTGDDEGGLRASTNMHPRGRQNVIFELGFFFGKLGRDRVVVLNEENVEKPSDISGLAYIDLDQAGAWKQTLARELEVAGISVDRSRIP